MPIRATVFLNAYHIIDRHKTSNKHSVVTFPGSSRSSRPRMQHARGPPHTHVTRHQRTHPHLALPTASVSQPPTFHSTRREHGSDVPAPGRLTSNRTCFMEASGFYTR